MIEKKHDYFLEVKCFENDQKKINSFGAQNINKKINKTTIICKLQ